MGQDDRWLGQAAEAWENDVERTAYYVVRESESPDARPANSRFPDGDSKSEPTGVKICGRCGRPMSLVAVLELSDATELAIRGTPRVTVQICPDPECRSDLASALAGRWATFIYRFCGTQEYGDAVTAWLSVIAEPARHHEPVEAGSRGWLLEPAPDIIDPTDYSWYPGEPWSHAQAVLSQIDDRVQRQRVCQRLVGRRSRWHDPKFGGYPHWRSIQVNGGCECSMRGTPVFTFSPSLCPSLCAPGTSAWLLMCKEYGLEHTGAVVFQATPIEAQLKGLIPGDGMFAL